MAAAWPGRNLAKRRSLLAFAAAVLLHLFAATWLLRTAETLIEDSPPIEVQLITLDALRPPPAPQPRARRRRPASQPDPQQAQ